MNIRNLWKMFFYGGVEKEEYKALRPDIRKENCVLLSVFSKIAGFMFFMLFLASKIGRAHV